MKSETFKVKKRLINDDVDKKGRPIFILAKFNGYILSAAATSTIQKHRDQKMFLDFNDDFYDKKTYLQRNYKIFSASYVSEDFLEREIPKSELEKWFIKWGENKLTTALIQLVKLDSFYANEMDNEKLLKVALSHSMLTKKLKNLLLSRIDYYEEDTKSLKNLLEFI